MSSLRMILLILLLLSTSITDADAQTTAVQPTESTGANAAPATEGGFSPWVKVAVVVGGAWLGSIVARRIFDRTWFSFVGGRLGAMLGSDAVAVVGL